MKRIFSLILAAGLMASCNDSGDKTQDPVDSLENRKDTLDKMIDSSYDAKIDSLEQRKDMLKDKADSSIDARRDSIRSNN
jgi:hypothetical protein